MKKSSFKGLFEIKDSRTYTGNLIQLWTHGGLTEDLLASLVLLLADLELVERVEGALRVVEGDHHRAVLVVDRTDHKLRP